MLKDLFKKAKYISIPATKIPIIEMDNGDNIQGYIICSKCQKRFVKYENLQKVCPSCGYHQNENL